MLIPTIRKQILLAAIAGIAADISHGRRYMLARCQLATLEMC